MKYVISIAEAAFVVLLATCALLLTLILLFMLINGITGVDIIMEYIRPFFGR